MPRPRESTLRKLIENGETSTIELKVAVPRPGEMAERLCGLPLEATSQEEVGREGIEPSWVAPGDFKSPASTISPPPQADKVSLCA